jgi:hypothetical protein
MTGEEYVAVAIVLVIPIFTMIEIAFRLDEEHYPLKLFLLWASTFLIVPVIRVGSQIAIDATMSSNIQSLMTIIEYAVITILVVETLYFAYMVLQWSLFSFLKKKNPLRIG